MSQNPRILVVYYSFEGNTRLIAQAIAAATGAETLELTPRKEIATHGFMKFFWGGRQAVMKIQPELEPFEVDPKIYDLLFIGTPVWAFTYALPLRAFFSKCCLAGKKVAFFCCNDGGKGKTFENFRKALNGNEILGEIEFVAPLKRNREQAVSRAKEWASQIVGKA